MQILSNPMNKQFDEYEPNSQVYLELPQYLNVLCKNRKYLLLL